MFIKIKVFISSINFQLSDLFLAIGFIPMVFFLMYGQEFMQFPNPDDVSISVEFFTAMFTILIIFWGTYIYIEYKNKNTVNRYINIIFILLGVLGVTSILIQPSHFEMDFINLYSAPCHVEMDISTAHYLFFIYDIISILLFIYIGLFLFPKRFKTIKFIPILGYVIFLGCLALVIYSFIEEKDNYLSFFEALKTNDVGTMRDNCIKSFIINPNAYGMALLIGIIFCCINHSISHRWWYFPIAIFFFINMLFSLCRASILISIILFIVYIYGILISTIKERKKRNILLLSLLSTIIIGIVLLFGITYLSKGRVLPNIYNVLQILGDEKTISGRESIWNNTYYLLFSQSLFKSFLFGRGFGIMNEMLLQTNYAHGFDSQYMFPTHNAYLNLFAEGGMIYLFSYLALLFYIVYKLFKLFANKKSQLITLSLSFGLIAFSIYSLIETIHYLVYPFMLLILIYNNTVKNN